jgi:ribose transport system ATP-binding protein
MTTNLQTQPEPRVHAPVPALEVRGLVKHYPGVKALDGVDLVVHQHEVLGLAGENGAGKSTLLKALVGLVRPDGGEIWVRGEKVRLRSVVEAADHGIGMVFQEQSLVPNLTAAENIVLGSEGPGVRRGVYRWKTMRRLAQEQLDKIGSHIDPLARTDTLSFADRQMVEIAKVLRIEERTSHPPVIILDEPTSVLESKEIETLFTQVRRLREFASVVFVSHRLDEVLDVCDRVAVLRGGRSVGELPAADAAPVELHRMMIGSTGADDHYHGTSVERQDEPSRPRLVVRGLSGRTFRDVDLDVHAGEIVGIVGVHGSGREDVCRALFGAEPTTAGEVVIDGERLDLSGT